MAVLEDLCTVLTEQVGVAKGSLLEAAVQGPMYGVLHCIRELLRDVDLRYHRLVLLWSFSELFSHVTIVPPICSNTKTLSHTTCI